MPYAVLEKEIKTLPVSLQKDIESYIMSVVNKYKKDSATKNKNVSASNVINELTGIISDSPNLTAKEIRSERLLEKYGV